MLIFWATEPHTGRIVTQCGIANKVKIEGDKPTLNPYFYGPKYHFSDALPGPEIFKLILKFYPKIINFAPDLCKIPLNIL